MNPWQEFEELAARSRGDVAPPVDVTAAVLAALQSPARSRPAVVDRRLTVWSVLSAVAASAAAVVAILAWNAWTDPLFGLFESLTLVIQ